MTASEQHGEYAAATPTIGKKLRAAIEADVLRRVADEWEGDMAGKLDTPWFRGYRAAIEGVVEDLRAEADCIEGEAR